MGLNHLLFGLFAAAAWWVLDAVSAGKSRAVERLDELKNPSLRRKAGSAKKQDAVSRVLEKASVAAAPCARSDRPTDETPSRSSSPATA